MSKTRKRLVAVFCFTLLMVGLFPFVKFAIGDLINLYGDTEPVNKGIQLYEYLRLVGQNIFYCLFITALYEAIYFFELWKQVFQQTEALKKEQLISQLQSLKEQVGPHFLFNSLNTLSFLVSRDTVKAERFIEEMAAVHRYLLEMTDRYLVTLEEELAFIRSYTHLLKTRYNNYFQVVLDIDMESKNLMLPPLTLQLLIENAVKHNIVDSQRPLELTIRSKDSHALIVQNRIQKKRQPVRSERKGLANIMARFELLGFPPLLVDETSEYFTIVVPLKANAHASIDY